MPPKRVKQQQPQPRKAHSVSEDSDYDLPDTFEEEEEEDEDEDMYEEESTPPPRKKGRGQSRMDRVDDEEDDGYVTPSPGRKIPKKAPAAKKTPQPKQNPPPKKAPAKKNKVPSPKKPDYYGESGRKSRNEVISEEELPVMNVATKPQWIYCSYDLGSGHVMKMCRVRVTKEDDDQFDFDAIQYSTKNADGNVFKYNMKIETVYAQHAALTNYISRLEAKNKKNEDFEYDE